MAILAADLGGTTIKVGLVDGERLLQQSKLPAESGSGLARRLEPLAIEFNRLMSNQGVTAEHIDAVVLGPPSLVNTYENRIESTNAKYSDSKSLDLDKWGQQWQAPFILENDANAALAGEWQYGAGRGCDNLALLIVGTGVGTAAIVEGRPLRGASGHAGVLGGHVTVMFDDELCECGNVGCVEEIASTRTLEAQARKHPQYEQSVSKTRGAGDWDYELLFEAADQRDPVAVDLRDQNFRAWGTATVGLVHAYDPERIIVSGGVIRRSEEIVSAIANYVDRYAWQGTLKTQVVADQLGDAAALLGLAYLAKQRGATP